MRSLVALGVLLLAAPALAGCLTSNAPATTGPIEEVRSNAQEAGAVAGPAPAAPSQPYKVTAREASTAEAAPEAEETTTTAYPLKLRTNPAREPVLVEASGTFNATECSYFGNLNPMVSGWRWRDLSDALEPGDVYSYSMNLTWTNTEQSWGEIHLFYGLGGKSAYNEESTAAKRGPVSVNFTGQGYRMNADDPAWIAVTCWFGQVTTPIEYKVSVEFTFAQDAVPAETPIAVVVPDNATRLLVGGVGVDPSVGVPSHYRVFGPDDKLVCECALSSADQATSLKLDRPGEYVVLVDHTANGFVSLALDAPSSEPLRPLDVSWSRLPIVVSDGEAIDETVELELPTVPLGVYLNAAPAGRETGASIGRGVEVELTNARGVVAHARWEGYASYRLVTPNSWQQSWLPIPIPGEWAYTVDHHAFDAGAHSAAVKADALRGEVALGYLTYAR